MTVQVFTHPLWVHPFQSSTYISDEEEAEEADGGRARTRASITTLASTLESTNERLTSSDHYAALAAQRDREREQRQLEAEDETRRKAERRARREERKARARAEALRSLSGTASSFPGDDVFEVVSPRFHPEMLGWDGDTDDADLDGELYMWKKKPSAARSASGSHPRSRTSASFSAGDASHIHTHAHVVHQSTPYPHMEMLLPAQMMNKKTKKLSHRASKRTSAVSSVTSQSTSTVPYTPVESVVESRAVAAFPIPQERCMRDGGKADFPSVGLRGARRPKLDPRSFTHVNLKLTHLDLDGNFAGFYQESMALSWRIVRTGRPKHTTLAKLTGGKNESGTLYSLETSAIIMDPARRGLLWLNSERMRNLSS